MLVQLPTDTRDFSICCFKQEVQIQQRFGLRRTSLVNPGGV